MGHGIARAFAAGDWSVVLWDSHSAALDQAVATVNADRPNAARAATSLEESVSAADVIVEALPEQLGLKRAFLAEVDRYNTAAIVTSNTSAIRITDIAAESDYAHRVVGTHWWNPPHIINVVEVAGGDRTDPAVRATAVEHLTALGKQVIVVEKDVNGFIGNRMQFALWREAMSMLENGVADARTIDTVARETFGRRLAAMGPLENADYIGLDLTRSILGWILPTLSADTNPSRLLDAAVTSGELGAKSGQGLLEWRDGDRERAKARLEQHLLGTTPSP
jgi:3-hydroxybutyryl-CoA dehydrogenase